MKIDNIYSNLITQLNKIHRHSRLGSFQTRGHYYDAMKRFCRFLAETYHLEKLANVAPKHIEAYVKYMQDKGLSPSTIKTDLSAVMFFHDQTSNARYTLPSNDNFNLEPRKFGTTDMTWTDEEFSKMVEIAEQLGLRDYAAIIYIGRFAGLRIHECFKIDTATARNAVKNMKIIIKGKGGLTRTISITQPVRDKLQEFLDITSPGHKLFVPDGVPTHIAIKRLQYFIITHRGKVQGEDSDGVPIHMHGTRHNYAASQYVKGLNEGKTERQSKRTVSELLGHHRPNITDIYLSSVKDGNKPDKHREKGGDDHEE